MKKLILIFLVFIAVSVNLNGQEIKDSLFIKEETIVKTIDSLSKKYPNQSIRIEKGVKQVAALWIESDGKDTDFETFCIDYFVSGEKELDELTLFLSHKFEVINGNLSRISKEMSFPISVDTGEITPLERLFSRYSVGANTTQGHFKSKTAFVTALNYPRFTDKQMREQGADWDKKQWGYAYMGNMFTSRPDVKEENKNNDKDEESKGMEPTKTTPRYTDNYKIRLKSLEDMNGNQTFEKEDLLLYHWKTRDEIRMLYGLRDKKAVDQQKTIYQAMKRIIEQTVPKQVINSKDNFVWNPFTNVLKKDGVVIDNEPTEDERYAFIRNMFIKSYKAEPDGKKYLDGRFEGSFDLTYKEVDSMFVKLLSSAEARDVVILMKKRLGRELQAYDVWYTGFNPRNMFDAKELDAKIKAMYPTPQSFEDALPAILMRLGYTPKHAKYIGEKIAVDPTRAAGHAQGSSMKGDKSRLRTNFYADGMDYGGYQTGMHELGHTTQQTISTYMIDNYALRGLPNSAISEAAAYIYEYRAWKGLMDFENQAEIDNLNALDKFWVAYEMTGMALCELRTWEWMYQQKEFTVSELKDKMNSIAKDIWNTYHAPIFGVRDEPILAAYNHQLNSSFYLAGYALGHLVHIQIEQYIADKDFPSEIERIYGFGRATPDLWMKHAVGNSLSVDAVLEFGRNAMSNLNELGPQYNLSE